MRLKQLATLAAAIAALAFSPASLSAQDEEQELQPNEAETFVLGNVYFLALHEVGHAMIKEYDIPVHASEEDMVDRLATWALTPDDEEEDPPYLVSAMIGWFDKAAAGSLDKIQWWDSHGTDQQRAYTIACLFYGDNPKKYKQIADAAQIPAQRRTGCVREAQQNDRSWLRTLAPYARSDDAEDVAPKEDVTLTYGETQRFEEERQLMMRYQSLEKLRDVFTDDFKFEPGITVSAEECGEPNAFWKERERKLLICYELVSEYRKVGEQLMAE